MNKDVLLESIMVIAAAGCSYFISKELIKRLISAKDELEEIIEDSDDEK